MTTQSWEEYLRASAVPRSVIEEFIERPHWATFDPELGYVLHNSLVQWGIDDSRTIETFRPDGARSRFLYANRTPRINTYGNSFTECNQVSDGETWQEYLAGHFGEPIGNYGVGSYGVHQAHRRLLRVEQTEAGAEYVVLYVWGDDPTRSIMRGRWGLIYPWYAQRAVEQSLFHGNPWSHLELDLDTGLFVDHGNPLPTPESLYAMTDPDWMVDHLRDDLAMQLAVYAGQPDFGLLGAIDELDRPKIARLAEALEFPFDWSAGSDLRRQAAKLLNRYGQRATNVILDRTRAFADEHGKTLLVILNFTARSDQFRDPLTPWDGPRLDQEIVDHLAATGFNVFDMNLVHLRDHEATAAGRPYGEYMSQYVVGGAGHYNPRGNHFFAYALKDTLLDLLEPKPLPYQDRTHDTVDFRGYLPAA
jgi:hypothetical protein